MSLSTPTTSMPSPAKCRTDSEPIRPAEPVTTTTLLIKTSAEGGAERPEVTGRAPPAGPVVAVSNSSCLVRAGNGHVTGSAHPTVRVRRQAHRGTEDMGGLNDGVSSGHGGRLRRGTG